MESNAANPEAEMRVARLERKSTKGEMELAFLMSLQTDPEAKENA